MMFVNEILEGKSRIKICRLNGDDWKDTELPIFNSADIHILTWSQIGSNKIVLFDEKSKTLQIFEYEFENK